MRLLDNNGRLFGKVNIIDAAVLLILCLLIPLAYGAYLLFRTLPARIIALEPAVVQVGTTQVDVRGENLRPYLRVAIGTVDGTLLFGDPSSGVLRIPSLEPGPYDIVLYDEAREISRLSDGLTVGAVIPPVPPASDVELRALGTFLSLEATRATDLSQAFPTLSGDWGHVVGVREPQAAFQYLEAGALPVADGQFYIKAVLQLRCVLEGVTCRGPNGMVRVGNQIPIDVPDGVSNFVIEELHPVYQSQVDLLVRAVLPIGVFGTLTDFAFECAFCSVPVKDETDAAFPARDALRPSVISTELMGQSADGTGVVMMLVRVAVVRVDDAWVHHGVALRLGDEFTIRTSAYEINGLIADIRP